MPQAVIKAIEYYLPEAVLTNAQLAAEFPDWTEDKILQKVGISERHLASDEQCASDLAVEAARKLFATGSCSPGDVDFLLLCTQSPDYFLPATACLIQHRLGIPIAAGALDISLGCSGFVYGLSLAKGLIETGQASCVLLLTAETMSKHLRADDHSARILLGDAAAATLIVKAEAAAPGGDPWIGPFVFGTDGRGADQLVVRVGGSRCPTIEDLHRKFPAAPNEGAFYMNGPDVFAFILRAVPECIARLLERSGKRFEDIDLFVFHQANAYMMEHLRRKLGIPHDRFAVALRQFGNTASATIPIALFEAMREGRLSPGQLVMLVGFGVGYSWGAALVRWAAPLPEGLSTSASRSEGR